MSILYYEIHRGNNDFIFLFNIAPSGIQSGNLVLFKTTDHGLQSFSLSDIQSIRGPTLKTKYQRKIMKNCLSIDYKNESGSNDTGLMKYLTFGITWAPSYK